MKSDRTYGAGRTGLRLLIAGCVLALLAGCIEEKKEKKKVWVKVCGRTYEPGLKKLTCTGVSVLKDLDKLPKLEELTILHSSLADLGPAARLDLKRLVIKHTPVTDLSAISGWKKLEFLELEKVKLAALPKMTCAVLMEIKLKDTPLSSLASLKSCTSLQRLTILHAPLKSLDGIEGATSLKILKIHKSPISTIKQVAALLNLERLMLRQMPLTDISGVEKLAKLRLLSLKDDKQLTTLPPLKGLVGLKTLILSYTGISDLNSVKDMVSLKQLYAAHTKVESLAPLKNLDKLKQLYVSYTKVSDLKPLEKLPALNYLDITATKVKKLKPLHTMMTLETINLGKIEFDPKVLEKLRELRPKLMINP